MAQVLVLLARQVSFREKEDEPELSYGPGLVMVPQPLADSLKEWGMIEGVAKGTISDEWVSSERLLPSTELPASFPSREYLYMAGQYTYGNVAELTPEAVVALPGIGEARAAKINAAIEVVRMKLPQVGGTEVSSGPQPNAE